MTSQTQNRNSGWRHDRYADCDQPPTDRAVEAGDAQDDGRDVNVFYGEKQALFDVDLDIPDAPGDGADRPVGLRQVDLPALPQPHERHDRRLPRDRRDPARRRGHLRPRRRRGAAARPRRHGVPEAQPVPEVDLRQRRLRPAHPRPGPRQGRDGRDRRDAASSAPACGTRSRTGCRSPAPASPAASSSACASPAPSRSAPR